MSNWFHTPKPEVQWLIDGLITADGDAAVCGKPKAGKSSFIRSLVAAVIKGGKFLDRSIELPSNTGRVLYIHLDVKDRTWRVVEAFKQLGITEKDSHRLTLCTHDEIEDKGYGDRLAWLKQKAADVQPHLVVIDVLWQFVEAENANDYQSVLRGINRLQQELRKSGFNGALLAALHSRKAVSASDPSDDVLGSTAQRGSFGTLIILRQQKEDGSVYTISSDQTDRDEHYGEIPETVITRSPDGTLALGPVVKELVKQQKKDRFESDFARFVTFVTEHPGVSIDEIIVGLSMSKKRILDMFEQASPEFVWRTGKGTKGDGFKYYAKDYTKDEVVPVAA